MFNMPDYTNNLLGTIAAVQVQKLPETVCKDCLIEMDEIERDVDVKTYPISGPEVVRVNWIKLRCKNCGEIVKIDQ